MSTYELTVARVEEPGSPPLIVVLVPWAHFSHGLGPAEYCREIAKSKNMPVAVSLSPEGRWHCDKFSEHHWKRITSKTPPEKLGWHTMPVTGGEDPKEQMAKWIAAGIKS